MSSPTAAPTTARDTADGGLLVQDLKVGYGTSQALFGATFNARGGSTLAVLGVNGSGKSTFGRAVAGLVPITGGRIYFDGTDITGLSPHRISRAGLRYIPEGRGIFPGLTVNDNLKQALMPVGRGERGQALHDIFETYPVLFQRRSQRAGSMSGGEQQILAMSLALMSRPKLIIADEMSLGLAPKMVSAVFDSLERARSTGITVILIEQFIHRALAFADDCVILNRGTVGWFGEAGSAGTEVLDRYLGETSAD
ncbi:ABC transporter ATP-binding protein [Actinoplanes sp. NPDC026619]|uniref:ABC transporter ATP-binding protein n=1 Tax=Actinoplanes sp. NPDC026619 TaxID=3155798 RepID=UPI0033FAAF35